MERTANPEVCWYSDNQLGNCPFGELEDDPDLLDLVEFAMIAAEKHTGKNESDGRKVDHYGIEPTRFRLACEAYGVPRNRTRDALSWSAAVCAYANEAPDAVINEELEKLRQEREDDG